MISPPERAYSRKPRHGNRARARKGAKVTERQYSGDSAAGGLPTGWSGWIQSPGGPGVGVAGAWRTDMATAELRCRCGEVAGTVANASAQAVNHIVCYCDDCQAFAHQLGRADLLDAKGGSDIVQLAPATLTFTKGRDRIAGVRLTAKGLFRWHTTCCNTPVGNTLGPAIPFVGIVTQAFDTGAQRADQMFGLPSGAILGKYA